MKSIIASIFSLVMVGAFAQSSSSYMYLDANIGTRMGSVPAGAGYTTTGAGLHFDGALGFMMTPVVGVKGVLGYDGIGTMYVDETTNETIKGNTYLMRMSLEGVISISELAKLDNNMGVNFHAGIGWSSMGNKDWVNDAGEKIDDGKLIGSNDDMGNAIFGLKTLYHLNDNLSLTADVSAILLVGNDRNLSGTTHMTSTGSYQTLTVGVNIRFK